MVVERQLEESSNIYLGKGRNASAHQKHWLKGPQKWYLEVFSVQTQDDITAKRIFVLGLKRLISLVRVPCWCKRAKSRLGPGFHRPSTAVTQCFTADTGILLISNLSANVCLCRESQ